MVSYPGYRQCVYTGNNLSTRHSGLSHLSPIVKLVSNFYRKEQAFRTWEEETIKTDASIPTRK